MTLRKNIALFAAGVAVIGAGTFAATAQPASAAPLIASHFVVAAHDGGSGWQNSNGNRDQNNYGGNRDQSRYGGGRDQGNFGGDQVRDFRQGRDDQRFYHQDGDRDYRDDQRFYHRDGDRDYRHDRHDRDRDYQPHRDRHDDGFNLSIHL